MVLIECLVEFLMVFLRFSLNQRQHESPLERDGSLYVQDHKCASQRQPLFFTVEKYSS